MFVLNIINSPAFVPQSCLIPKVHLRCGEWGLTLKKRMSDHIFTLVLNTISEKASFVHESQVINK